MQYNQIMAKQGVKRVVVEIDEETRDILKAVAAFRRVTMRDLIDQSAREMAKADGINLPPAPDKKNAPVE